MVNAFWIPAGLTFSGMTGLDTFSKFGLGGIGETLAGGLLGMGSGWIGSFFAVRSVNSYQEELKGIFKSNEQGRWLILLETPLETELPWQTIREINPIEIVNLNVI